jgi:hypothetical protein
MKQDARTKLCATALRVSRKLLRRRAVLVGVGPVTARPCVRVLHRRCAGVVERLPPVACNHVHDAVIPDTKRTMRRTVSRASEVIKTLINVQRKKEK